jgi:riboflavin transporter FmnP
MKPIHIREITVTASLAALSAAAQLFHLGYQFPQWGMWLDAVAIPWLIAYFMFGLRSAVIVSLLGSLVITLFSPDTWLGAVMKFSATLPLLITLTISTKFINKQLLHLNKFYLILAPLLVGLIIRSSLMLPLNYYWAIPIWTGLTADQAMTIIPWYVIAGINSVQAIIDVVLAWLLVFKFKLYRYASWTR